MKLLIVCSGNICRSPTAEGIINHICNTNNYKDIYCKSAGLFDYHIGKSPDKRSINIAKKNNINIENIKASKININDFEIFDLILGMDKNHILQLKNFNLKKEKIKLYLNFTTKYKNQDVPDPYYGGIKEFNNVFKLIELGAKAIVKQIKY